MEIKYLQNIKGPEDVKKLKICELECLADEMRYALVKKLSVHGGHIGPNLGFVEATVALHYVFSSPYDKMVFDVSHQTYCHKMLTGRAYAFLDESRYDEVSGYSNPKESVHDLFTIGHTSTSVSLALGLAKARNLAGGNENVIAVIGDGSLSGGEALEGLDYAGEQTGNFIIVVNDNEMSIAENHGGIYKNLALLRETKGKAQNNLFKAMGLDYVYVDEGNDVEKLIEAFESVKNTDHAVVVHVHTKKGKGLAFAEKDPETYHSGGPFDPVTGKYLFAGGESYNDIMRDYLLDKMKKDSSVVAINAATPVIVGFTKDKREIAGKQFVDVGIAEETAAAMASGVATYGGKPVWAVFSSFVQRCYDQISQDICINESPVTMLVFAASVKAFKDVTHLGIFDIPMLKNIPNLVYLAPTNAEELLAMTEWSLEQKKHPVAIRVPSVVEHAKGEVAKDYSEINKYRVTEEGEKLAIIAAGGMYSLGEELAAYVEKTRGFKPTLVNPVFLTGLDKELLEKLKENHTQVVTIEDGVLSGGFGETIASYYGASGISVYNYGLKKQFIDRYNVDDVLKENHLTVEQIVKDLEV